jgi:PEGA domain
MASTPFRTAALLVAGLTLVATPSFAQRRGGGEGGRRDGGGGERAVPRDRTERAQPQGRVEGAQPQGRVERSQPRGDDRGGSRPNVVVPRAVQPNRSYGNNNRSYDNRSYDNRNRSYGNRSYDNRSYNRSYGGRVYVPSYNYPRNRVYVAPFGYRPYGYRPGWSLNLYFGRPYGAYAYSGYGGGYGYYAIAPGRLYGSVRIVDAPPDAQVFVDGYYAGVVDDYDGVFQHLNLEVGTHHIEIEDPGYPPIAFDVRIEPGQTVTYRANGQY